MLRFAEQILLLLLEDEDGSSPRRSDQAWT